MTNTILNIGSMNCVACANNIERIVGKIKGVARA